MHSLFKLIAAVALVLLAAAFCVASDRIKWRRRLKELRKQMQLWPDLTDEAFATSLCAIEPAEAIEMRRMLAVMLGVEVQKIRPEWKFREERNLKNLNIFIFGAFAHRYAPEKFRGRTFAFPTDEISTVADLFQAAWRLRNDS